MIPPRERRRAPQTVKMAIETMSQAFTQSGLAADDVSVIMASAMGDLKITDYMCTTLADNPRLISPTQFHNSVHNAAVGYWSISQSSHAACNAVAAGEFSGSAGLLEAAVLSTDRATPVLLVIQEGHTPATIMPLCPPTQALSLAIMLVPRDCKPAAKTLAHLRIGLQHTPACWPKLPAKLSADYAASPAGKLLPLFAALARYTAASPEQLNPSSDSFSLPVSAFSCLQIDLLPTKTTPTGTKAT